MNTSSLTALDRGHHVEAAARHYLTRQGLVYVTANYTCQGGEIDLILRDQDVLVFVEVRYRKPAGYGDGADSVTRTKQQRLIRAALHYLQTEDRFDKTSCRFDVVSVTPRDQGDDAIEWIKDAFQVEYGRNHRSWI